MLDVSTHLMILIASVMKIKYDKMQKVYRKNK
jgi:hypothetical protein